MLEFEFVFGTFSFVLLCSAARGCFSLQSASHQISKLHDYTSWWFQPIRKICSSNWIISPSSDVFFSKIFELTPPRWMLSICLLNLSKSFETAISFFQGWHHGTHGMGSMGWDLIYLLSWGPNMAGWKMDLKMYCWRFVRNPARKPVEVGSWNPIIYSFFLHPNGGAGFLNQQQYVLLKIGIFHCHVVFQRAPNKKCHENPADLAGFASSVLVKRKTYSSKWWV